MNAKKFLLLTLLVLPIALMGANTAWAQETSSEGEYITPHIIDTTFPFEVGGKVLPAGKYEIDQPTRELLIFRPEKGPSVEAKIITRLARPSTPLVEPKIVFDKVGDRYYASEVWFPRQDGFLLFGAQQPHTHHSVKAVKK
jgi:hypothetical protein